MRWSSGEIVSGLWLHVCTIFSYSLLCVRVSFVTVKWLSVSCLTPAHYAIESNLQSKVSPITMVKQGLCTDCLRPRWRPVPKVKQRDKNISIGLGQAWPIPSAETISPSKPRVYSRWGVEVPCSLYLITSSRYKKCWQLFFHLIMEINWENIH